MTKEEVKKLPLGLYRIFWKEGGSSIAAVGNDHQGNRWLAPCNWISGSTTGAWRYVERMELIEKA